MKSKYIKKDMNSLTRSHAKLQSSTSTLTSTLRDKNRTLTDELADANLEIKSLKELAGRVGRERL